MISHLMEKSHSRNFSLGASQKCNIKIRILYNWDSIMLPTFNLIDFILYDQQFLSFFVKSLLFDLLLKSSWLKFRV